MLKQVKRLTPLTGEGREAGREGQSHKEEEREGGSGLEGAKGPLAREGGLYLNIRAKDPRVPSYATADGAGQPA